MKRCLILTGGKLSLAFAGSFLKEHKFEKVVAVDGGLEAAKELDIIPDVIVGDFDTVHPEILAYYRKMEHIVWEVHQPEKDDTDTMLAVKQALSVGAEEIQIYGGLGGRFDHSIANVQTLRYLSEHGAVGSLCDAQNWMTVQTTVTVRQYPRRDGWYFSLLSLSDTCTGVTITGAKYCLQNGTLHANFPLGISNEIVVEQAEISLQTGTLLVLYTKDA